MLRAVSAELRYGAVGLLAWFAVLLTVSLWPLLERPSVATLPTALAMMAMALPFVSVIGSLHLLGVERSERRLRLFRSLPLPRTHLAASRLVRSLAIPLLAVGAALLIVVLGFAAAGGSFLASLEGAWVLLTLLLLAVAAALLTTLLYDIGGMTFAQVFGVALLAGVFLLNSASPEVHAGALTEPLVALVQTPLGALLVLLVCAALFLLDIVVVVRR